MSDERPTEVLGALPRTRPHRRSEKRPARPSKALAAPQQSTGPEAPAAPEAPAEPVAPTAQSKPAAKAKAKPKPPAKAKAPAKAKPAAKRRPGPKAEPRSTATPQALAGARKPRLQQPAQPGGTPARAGAQSRATRGRAEPPARTDVIGTAVQAAAEIAEIGLSVGARAIRRALSRLPRP